MKNQVENASSSIKNTTINGQVVPLEGDCKQQEDIKRLEYERSEAERKAKWEAAQKAKKEVEQEQINRVAAMATDELIQAAKERIGKDTEKLTRRNMKDCVAHFIQEKCMENPEFARLVMQPKKTMIHCFQYINRMAYEFIKQETKDNAMQPLYGIYGSDVPDDLCYQWAIDYFKDPTVQEDEEKDEKFIPRTYIGKTVTKKKTTKPNEKKPEKKKEVKNAPNTVKDEYQQLTLMDQLSLI